MLRVVLELDDVVVPVRAAHQVSLGAAAHPPDLFEGLQHASVMLARGTPSGKCLPRMMRSLPLLGAVGTDLKPRPLDSEFRSENTTGPD